MLICPDNNEDQGEDWINIGDNQTLEGEEVSISIHAISGSMGLQTLIGGYVTSKMCGCWLTVAAAGTTL